MYTRDEVVWPGHMNSDLCELLKGLLHKDPLHRLSWPLLLSHPFITQLNTTSASIVVAMRDASTLQLPQLVDTLTTLLSSQ